MVELVAPDDVPLELEAPLSDGYRLWRSSSLRFWSYVDPLLADPVASPLELAVPVDEPSPLIDEPLEVWRSPLIVPVLADPVPLADPLAAPLPLADPLADPRSRLVDDVELPPSPLTAPLPLPLADPAAAPLVDDWLCSMTVVSPLLAAEPLPFPPLVAVPLAEQPASAPSMTAAIAATIGFVSSMHNSFRTKKDVSKYDLTALRRVR